ncbi:Hha/YmoA family nucleoid-associated regulatory protein [Klebsiella pneumoniae]
MTRKKYLLKFRRCQTLHTLEQVYSHMKDSVPSSELGEFEGACDHRRAEITHGQLWDKVPASAWKNVS